MNNVDKEDKYEKISHSLEYLNKMVFQMMNSEKDSALRLIGNYMSIIIGMYVEKYIIKTTKTTNISTRELVNNFSETLECFIGILKEKNNG